MKLLITGGTGFVGAHLSRAILDGILLQDLDITEIVVLGSSFRSTPPHLPGHHYDDGRLTFVRGDMRDMSVVNRAMAGVNAVVHLAGVTHVDTSFADPSCVVSTNVMGTFNLLEAASKHRVWRFVQVSTRDVYGNRDAGGDPSVMAPRSPYAASKAAADLIADTYRTTLGLEVVITRSHNNYGPGQLPEKLIPKFVTNLIREAPVTLYGDGSRQHRWIHVRDHCRAIAAALRYGLPGEVYDLPGSEPISILELTGRLLTLLDRGWDMVRFAPPRQGSPFDPPSAHSNPPPGFTPVEAFGSGLEATVEWFADHRWWWEPLLTSESTSPTASARRTDVACSTVRAGIAAERNDFS